MGGGVVHSNHSHNPGAFGFEYWLSNFGVFEVDPILSRNGKFEDFLGDSSDIVVAEALKFISAQSMRARRALTVIWYPSPHEPWVALNSDRSVAAGVFKSRYYGEVHALDRSIGTLRRGLREQGVENTTLLVFSSDNGGYHGLPVQSNGGLKGYKKEIFEGGIRVPAIIEWPDVIKPRVSWHPTCAYDLFPTLVDLVGLPKASMLQPQDGMSLVRLFGREVDRPRTNPIIIKYKWNWALIDNDMKLITSGYPSTSKYSIFNLSSIPKPVSNSSKALNHSLMMARIMGNEHLVPSEYKRAIADERNRVATDSPAPDTAVHRHVRFLRKTLLDFASSLNASRRGRDYPEDSVFDQPPSKIWCDLKLYRPYLPDLLARPQHRNELRYLSQARAMRFACVPAPGCTLY
jgi:hypothetical protein